MEQLITNNLGVIIAAIITGLYLLFKNEQGKRRTAEAQSQNAETKIKDAKLEVEVDKKNEELALNNKRLEELEEAERNAAIEELTPDESVAYWKKKNGS